jgi:hypothetical protein
MKNFTASLLLLFAFSAHADSITHNWTLGRDPHCYGLVGLSDGDRGSTRTAICFNDDFLGFWIVPLHIYWVVAIAIAPILVGIAFYLFCWYRRRHENAAMR